MCPVRIQALVLTQAVDFYGGQLLKYQRFTRDCIWFKQSNYGKPGEINRREPGLGKSCSHPSSFTERFILPEKEASKSGNKSKLSTGNKSKTQTGNIVTTKPHHRSVPSAPFREPLRLKTHWSIQELRGWVQPFSHLGWDMLSGWRCAQQEHIKFNSPD